MATEQQVQAMLDALQRQMGQFEKLQEDNAQLRALVGQHNPLVSINVSTVET